MSSERGARHGRRHDLHHHRDADALVAAARRHRALKGNVRIGGRLAFGVEMRRKKIAAVLPLGLLLVVAAVVAYRVFSFYADMYSDLPGM